MTFVLLAKFSNFGSDAARTELKLLYETRSFIIGDATRGMNLECFLKVALFWDTGLLVRELAEVECLESFGSKAIFYIIY